MRVIMIHDEDVSIVKRVVNLIGVLGVKTSNADLESVVDSLNSVNLAFSGLGLEIISVLSHPENIHITTFYVIINTAEFIRNNSTYLIHKDAKTAMEYYYEMKSEAQRRYEDDDDE